MPSISINYLTEAQSYLTLHVPVLCVTYLFTAGPQPRKRREGGCGRLIATVKFNHSIMNGSNRETHWGRPLQIPLTNLLWIHHPLLTMGLKLCCCGFFFLQVKLCCCGCLASDINCKFGTSSPTRKTVGEVIGLFQHKLLKCSKSNHRTPPLI